MTLLELTEQIRSGSNVRAAQEQLYAMVRSALLERIGEKIPASLKARLEPEEVLDAAFLRAMAALGCFHATNEPAFIAWVYSIAKQFIANPGERPSEQDRHSDSGTVTRRRDCT